MDIHDYLNEEQIPLLTANKELLKEDDFERFYQVIPEGYRPNFTKIFLACDINPLVYMDTVPSMYACCIENYNNSLPSSIYGIGDNSFAYTGITSVDLSNVASIKDFAFYECHELNQVTVGNSITTIPLGCFQECTSLQEILIPENVKYIGENAFKGCISLNSISILSKDCYVIPGAFRGTPKTAHIEVADKDLASRFKRAKFTDVNII